MNDNDKLFLNKESSKHNFFGTVLGGQTKAEANGLNIWLHLAPETAKWSIQF